MAPVFHECEQGSAEWVAARMGLPTASEFACLVATRGDGKGRATYMRKLAGEIITGEPMRSFTNADMQRGKDREGEARDAYAMILNTEVTRVGFVQNGQKGCSPDGLIAADGAVEVKITYPDLLIDLLLRNEFPEEHRAQCQGTLWVCEREWVDLAVYASPMMPLFRKRMARDESYIRKLGDAVDAFNDELAELVERVKRFGGRR